MEPIKKYYCLTDSIKPNYAWASILDIDVKVLHTPALARILRVIRKWLPANTEKKGKINKKMSEY